MRLAPPGGMGHTEPEILPELRHELLHNGGLARPAGAAEDQRLGRGRGRLRPEVNSYFMDIRILLAPAGTHGGCVFVCVRDTGLSLNFKQHNQTSSVFQVDLQGRALHLESLNVGAQNTLSC